MRPVALALCLCAAAPALAADEDPNAIARAVGEKFAAACAAAKVDEVVALYRDDARVVYPGAGQTATNKAELRKMVAATCAPGAPRFNLVGHEAVWADAAHTVVAAEGDWTVSGMGPEGKLVTVPIRATEVLVKTPAGWQYVADHASVGIPTTPADPKRAP